MNRRFLAVAFIACSSLGSIYANAQGRGSLPSITWHTIDAGGDSVSAGALTLSATIGQPDTGRVANAGVDMQAGFWNRETAINEDKIFSSSFE